MSKPKPKPEVKYRIVCARFHESRARDAIHREHAFEKSELKKAVAMVEWNNSAPVFTNPAPDKVGCLPWSIEARVVTPWEPWQEAEELAAMLERDWWDWSDEPAEPSTVPGK